MASSPINVPNPVSTPSSAQLAQIAANISGTLFSMIQKGDYLDVYDAISDTLAAVNCLAQALLVINNGTTSSVGTVQTRNAYALGANAVIPTNINTIAV